ncbi:hypothetical protein [Streptomyces sp. G1]|uniref:hypothetical protein n=1 Tax=Streptomyces sp. G1 TaxID=361572 RepID=UPI00202EDEF4|nr:hypothetical protein [Streptomyces sp. G1]MCM1970701.1 hypothetical protein [Streptomyces sp. G1]
MKRRILPTIALAATAALLLTACGSGDDGGGNDKAAGTSPQSSKPEPSKTASSTPAEDKPDGVDVSVPKDMNLVFDWDKPKDPDEAAAMEDAANFLRAIYRGVDKRTTKDAALTTYATGGALHYGEVQINEWIKGGWTGTGTRRHYDSTTRTASNGGSVEVAFCADTSKFYGKDVKTGKVQKTDPSPKDFGHYKIIMAKVPTADDLWQATKVFVETESAQCR